MNPGPTTPEFLDLEVEARHRATTLGLLERDAAEEFLRLMIGGRSSWEAQKMVDLRFAVELQRARADNEIVLARLRRS